MHKVCYVPIKVDISYVAETRGMSIDHKTRMDSGLLILNTLLIIIIIMLRITIAV